LMHECKPTLRCVCGFVATRGDESHGFIRQSENVRIPC
jgi:hypothetical protein